MAADKEWTIKEYDCGWCGYKFKMSVRSTTTEKGLVGGRAKGYSTQVRCPYCKNFLRTWDDGVIISETKDRKEAMSYKRQRWTYK